MVRWSSSEPMNPNIPEPQAYRRWQGDQMLAHQLRRVLPGVLADLFSGRVASEKDAWIPVAMSLPDCDSTVLVYRPTADPDVELGYWDGEHWRGPCFDWVFQGVTHWMPFPDPPHRDIDADANES